MRLRLQGSCSGCPSSTMTLKLAIEDAIHKVAPDIEEIEAEGVVEEPAPPRCSSSRCAGGPPKPHPAERMGDRRARWPSCRAAARVVKQVDGEAVLFVRVGGRFYGYRPACPGCGAALDERALAAPSSRCPGCARRYDVAAPAAASTTPQLLLEPLPLLQDDAGLVEGRARRRRSA